MTIKTPICQKLAAILLGVATHNHASAFTRLNAGKTTVILQHGREHVLAAHTRNKYSTEMF